MIRLFQYAYHFGINASPFCLKIELSLKILQIPFEIINDYSKASPPKGKLPYIEDSGKIIPDSHFILKYIKEKYKKDLNEGLSESQNALSYAFQKLVEEHLYWIIVYSKWLDENNAPITKKSYHNAYGAQMDEPILFYIRKTERDLEGVGLGLHSSAEIYELGTDALKAVETFINDKQGNFIFGESASLIDVIFFSFLWQIIKQPFSSPLKEFVEKSRIIMRYIIFLQNTWNVK